MHFFICVVSGRSGNGVAVYGPNGSEVGRVLLVALTQLVSCLLCVLWQWYTLVLYSCQLHQDTNYLSIKLESL